MRWNAHSEFGARRCCVYFVGVFGANGANRSNGTLQILSVRSGHGDLRIINAYFYVVSALKRFDICALRANLIINKGAKLSNNRQEETEKTNKQTNSTRDRWQRNTATYDVLDNVLRN